METTPGMFTWRKSHLKSETFRTMLRIVTCCSSQPRLCEAALFPSHRPTSDDVNNGPGEKSQTKVGVEPLEMVNPSGRDNNESNSVDRIGSVAVVDVDLGATTLQDEGLSNVQAITNDIENMIGTEDIGGGLVGKDLLGGTGGSSGNGFLDGGSSMAQQLLISELEDVLKGNEESVLEGKCDAKVSQLDKNGALHQEMVCQDQCGPSASEVPNMSSVSKESFVAGNDCSLCRTGELGEKKEMPGEDEGLEESVATAIGKSSSRLCKIQNGEVEEGEISNEFQNSDLFIHTTAKAQVLLGKEMGSKEGKQHKANRKDPLPASFMMTAEDHARCNGAAKDGGYIGDGFPCKRKVVVYEDPILIEGTGSYDEQNKDHRAKKRKDYDATYQKKDGVHVIKKVKRGLEASAGKEIGHDAIENKKDGIDRNTINCKVNYPNNAPLQAEESNLNATAVQGTTLMEKVASLDNKKKRGPPSAERKAKKKQKARKKRAEKNKEQGVKRLKLRPVHVRKPVSFCRHFLHGRCQEGAKCKFSHDTIPLTKSKPCSYFARRSCMKGDDCPFDHQLSKYPCSKFVEEGFCNRGKACLFSHQVPLKEGLASTSIVSTSGTSSPSSTLGISDPNKPLDISGTSNQMAKDLGSSGEGISRKRVEQTTTSAPRIPHQVPKGISILSSGKSLAVDFNHLQPNKSLSVSNEGVKNGNQADQSASGKLRSLDENPTRTLVQPPRGINFLSFGRSPLGCSTSAKFTWLANHSSAAKVSPTNSSIPDEQSGPSPALDNRNKVGAQARMGQVQMKIASAEQPPKSLLLAPVETSTSNSKFHEQPILSSLTRVSYESAESNKTSTYRQPDRCANPWALTASPSGLGQSPDNVGQASNPVHKALMSTMAFAAKVESEMKSNRSVSGDSSLFGDKAGSSSSGVSKRTPPPTSKISDFLSIIGDTQKN